MIRIAAICIALALACGCISNQGSASLARPDGTVYNVEQKTAAAFGGKAKAAEQQFTATYKTPEGVEITVKMGNGIEQPSTPNTIRDVTGLVGAIGALMPAPGGAAGVTTPVE